MASGQQGCTQRTDKSLLPWHYTFAAVILGLGTVLSLAIFFALDTRHKGQIGKEFDRVAADCQAALRWNLESHLGSAEAFRAFPGIAGGIDTEKFQALATPLLRQYPGVAALEWIPRVRRGDRPGWETAGQHAGLPGAEIREASPSGLVVRAGVRDEYFPVAVVVSASGNAPVLGLDLAMDPVRAEAMNLACDTGRATGIARMASLPEIGQSPAWAVFHPVYSGTAPAVTAEDRRTRLEGFVQVVIRLDRIAGETLDRLKLQGVSLYIFDGTEPRADGLVSSYPSAGGDLAAALSGDDHLRRAVRQELAGRVWTVVCVASPEFTQARQSWFPWAGLVIGLTFTGLLIGYVLGITVYSMRIRRLTDRLIRSNTDLEDELESHRHTLRELHMWEQDFRALAEHSPDIIARFGNDLRLLYVNPMIETVTGHRRAAFAGRTYREIGMPAEMVARWEETLKRVFDTGEEATVEIELPSPRGPRLQECILVPELAEEGFVQSVLAVNRDITARESKAREALQATERRCRELAEKTGSR
ncbi:MAG: CHASE domain-containing protein [Phycisphaerae bacterium]|nr:CHASE domain-containing protein [Phycisphaerae bacterium]